MQIFYLRIHNRIQRIGEFESSFIKNEPYFCPFRTIVRQYTLLPCYQLSPGTNYRHICILVMATYFESILLCICSIHIGDSFTLFTRYGDDCLPSFCLTIIGTQ